ncbi:hypothetical protein Tco_1438031 [Tanacetum coccineum]
MMMKMMMMMMKTLQLDQTRVRRQRGEEPKSQSLPRNHPPPRKPPKVVMDDAVNTAGEDVVHDDDQPQDTSKPKTNKSSSPDWFKQPPRPPTPDPEWNKRQVYVLNRLTIDNLTQDPLVGPTYNQLKEGDRYPFDFSKPIPLQGRPDHLTVVADYFFNNDLEFLKTSYPEKTYTTSITKTKEARYEIVGIEDMTSTLWSTIKHAVNIKKLHGYGHLEDIVVKRTDRQLYKFQECNFVDLHLNDIEDIKLLKKLNIIAPQKTFLEIEFKELYTPSYKPPRVIYEDLEKQKRVMRADELYKFLDGTLKTIRDEFHHRILDFRLGYNDEMSRRNWTAIDKRRSKLMVELIDKQMRERRIIRNLERLVGARELEMDYKLMTRTV